MPIGIIHHKRVCIDLQIYAHDHSQLVRESASAIQYLSALCAASIKTISHFPSLGLRSPSTVHACGQLNKYQAHFPVNFNRTVSREKVPSLRLYYLLIQCCTFLTFYFVFNFIVRQKSSLTLFRQLYSLHMLLHSFKPSSLLPACFFTLLCFLSNYRLHSNHVFISLLL